MITSTKSKGTEKFEMLCNSVRFGGEQVCLLFQIQSSFQPYQSGGTLIWIIELQANSLAEG